MQSYIHLKWHIQTTHLRDYLGQACQHIKQDKLTTERCKDKLCYYFRLSLVENLGASYEDHINVLCFAQSLLINYDLH